jgi:murein DD-endopeptidase MepM/ murein hydrolase activator NlpD
MLASVCRLGERRPMARLTTQLTAQLMAHRVRIIFWLVFLALAFLCIGASYHVRYRAEQQLSAQGIASRDEAREIQAKVVLFSKRAVPMGIPFASLLEDIGMPPLAAARVIASVQPVFDLRHLRAGNQLEVGRSVLGELRFVHYRIDAERVLSIEPHGDDFHSEVETMPSRIDTAGVSGQIHDSLFTAVTESGESPELAMRLAGIFGYDLDFYTDPRPGDTFRVVVEKKELATGETIAYGRILAAEYCNGGRTFSAILFHDAEGNPAYYRPDGKSMKKAFLRSPLKFDAPITSHFSLSRFHPILKEYRPHLGIDYGAPIGTPVQTIGDGKVIFAGPKGGDGNLVEVQHSNGYTTYYMHLSRILVRNGQLVGQGDRIGLVGMTGLATGPHLDFRIQLHGQFLNFEKLGLPTSDPISPREWKEFTAARDQALAEMPALPLDRPTLALNSDPAQNSNPALNSSSPLNSNPALSSNSGQHSGVSQNGISTVGTAGH